MTLFDLLLILMALGTAVACVATVVALVLRRWRLSGRLALALLLAWASYLGVGALVALKSPQRIMAIGEDHCFDEMCYAVTGWNRTPSPKAGTALYVVDVRITNRSQGHAQRELGRKGVLVDRSGRVYAGWKASTAAVAFPGAPAYPGLDAEVGPGQSLATRLVFEVPDNVNQPGFALGSDLKVNPARIVIGDEAHFLHWPTVVPLG